MEQYKQEFIEFMVDSDVLRFGEFTLRQFTITTVMILMCCSDRLTRVFR